MTARYTSDLDHAIAEALPHRGVTVRFTDHGHTADASVDDGTHFAATAGTSTAALAAAMTGLKAAMGGGA